NEMDLQRRKQMLTLLQRQPDQPRRIFSQGRATANLMDANDPIRSNQLQHDPPLHPELPATTTGWSHSTPTFWTVSHLYVLRTVPTGHLVFRTRHYGRGVRRQENRCGCDVVRLQPADTQRNA